METNYTDIVDVMRPTQVRTDLGGQEVTYSTYIPNMRCHIQAIEDKEMLIAGQIRMDSQLMLYCDSRFILEEMDEIKELRGLKREFKISGITRPTGLRGAQLIYLRQQT